MIDPQKLVEVTEGLKGQYDRGEVPAMNVVCILLALKMANLIAAPTVQIISEEIVKKEELPQALVETIFFAKSKEMRGLVELCKKTYG